MKVIDYKAEHSANRLWPDDWRTAGAIFLAMCVLLEPIVTFGSDLELTPISEARAQPAGTRVTIEGFVTVVPGTFESSTLEQGFALQSVDGGIYVSTASSTDVDLGDRVRVSGNMAENDNLTILETDISGVHRFNDSGMIYPRVVATGSVNEDVEGLLIQTTGIVTSDVVEDPPYGFKVVIDDGSGEIQVFVHMRGAIPLVDLSAVGVGDRVEVIGLGFQYGNAYEINPRGSADFKRVNLK